MRHPFFVSVALLGTALSAAAIALFSPAGASAAEAGQPAPPKTRQAWTLEEAMGRLHLAPDDAYLQYVVLQLARNEGKLDDVTTDIRRLRGRQRGGDPRREIDMFALFTGALAVQEALQLDAMLGDDGPAAPDDAKSDVPVASLEGPQIESHPWGEMLAAQQLAGKRAEVSALALCVPADQFFVRARSLAKLLEVADAGDLWGAHLFSQAAGSAKSHRTSSRMKRQLAVRTDGLTRPFYDVVVDEVAVTGSDLYFRAGNDVTLLFQLKQPELFRLRMDGFLAEAEKSRPDAVRSTGRMGDVEYVQVSTPDRAVHVFSAYPRPDLHVRSNSKAALARVLAAVAGEKNVERLGELTEFKYIRTLFEQGDLREHVFIYLSDPFVRRQVGPEVKLTETRRMVCYNHLRMIGHAAAMYQTQYGRAPKSLEELAAHGCAPGVFGEDRFRCPCGGRYTLSADGARGVCTVHGHADRLVPGLEVAVEKVTAEEAAAYREFVERYSRFWQQFFDPIVIRLQATPEHYRAETLILPMLDNSIYTGLAAALGGEPEPLDALPVPPSNIFSLAVRLNKENMLGANGMLGRTVRDATRSGLLAAPMRVSVEDLLMKGLGNQVGMHVCDASPTFDLNLTGMMGDMVRSFGGRNWGGEMTMIGFLVASLNTPVYVSIPVRDAEIVDAFLADFDALLAAAARRPPEFDWLTIDHDFYKVPLEGLAEPARCYSLSVGPVKWRVFFARLGDGVYIASKPHILEEIAQVADGVTLQGSAEGDSPIFAAGTALSAENVSSAAKIGTVPDPGPAAHGMIRIRPEHWDDILSTFRLGWAESSRKSCLDNLAPLSSVARAMRASADGPPAADAVLRRAAAVHAVHFFCPDGGRYELSADGTEVVCSVHGTAGSPRQQPAPSPGSPIDRLMRDFAGATAELTFLADGLHAVVTIRRKPAGK